MGFEGYTNDVLQSAIADLLSNEEDAYGNESNFEKEEFKKWKEERSKKDEKYIDEISGEDYTGVIRSVVPDYGGFQTKPWSGEEAREAIMDAVYEYHLSQTSLQSRYIWSTNKSARPTANQFGIGDAIGMYVNQVLGNRRELENLAALRNDAESFKKDRFELHIKALDDLKRKVESESLIFGMLTIGSRQLISDWSSYFAILQMSTIDEHMSVYDGDPDAESKKQKLSEYKDVLDRIQAIKPEIETRMEMMASGLSEDIDVDKICEMSTVQLKAIQAKVGKNETVKNDLFEQALKLQEKRLERQKKEIAQKLFNNDANLRAYDIDGKPGDIDELLQSGLPILITSESMKDKPQLVFNNGGVLSYGDNAASRFRIAQKAALDGEPKGFGWLWDKFCSLVGREDWRTETAKTYHKYERMLAEHPDMEENLNAPEKVELAETSIAHEKKPSKDENTAKKETSAAEKQTVKEAQSSNKEKSAQEQKGEREGLREEVKRYLRNQRNHYENTLTPKKVPTYLAYKSLSDIMDRFENDAASLSPEEQKAVGDVLLTENYAREINNFIRQRSEVAEYDPVYKAGLEEMEESYQENSWDNDDLLPMADEMAGLDAFKLTVPGKNKDEYSAELYYSANELDEGVRNTVKSLSENLQKQAEDLLSKNDMSRRDLCHAAVITHIVHEIRDGFEHTKNYVGLDEEFKAVVDLARADENCSKKLNDFIDSRVDMMELTAKFNKRAADPEKPGKFRLEAMEGNELKDVLAANLKDEVAESESEKFFVIQNDNALVKVLSSNDINKCVEQHNNLKEAGLSEKDRLVMGNYIGEIEKTLNDKYPDILQNLAKGKGLLRNQKADFMSYVEIRRGAEESLKAINGIADGEAIDKEKVKQVRSIENQITKSKDGLEEKRRIIEDALKKSDILAAMPTEKLLSVFKGKENSDSIEIRKDLERIRKADEEEKARLAAEEAKRNEAKKFDGSKKAEHVI